MKSQRKYLGLSLKAWQWTASATLMGVVCFYMEMATRAYDAELKRSIILRQQVVSKSAEPQLPTLCKTSTTSYRKDDSNVIVPDKTVEVSSPCPSDGKDKSSPATTAVEYVAVKGGLYLGAYLLEKIL